MAAGLAEARYATDPSAGPVTIVAPDGKVRWSPLWDHNPAIGIDPTARTICCGGHALPYVTYSTDQQRLIFSSTYRARDYRGHLYLTDDELANARDRLATIQPFILIDPYPRDRKNPNRHWSLGAWHDLIQLLVAECPLPLYQFRHPAMTPMRHIRQVYSPSFRDACALMAHARLVIALEGGIPFATAALNIPTVVLWGGCVSADVLSYPEQHNLVDPQHNGCGMVRPCPDCFAAWARLSPRQVADTVLSALSRVAPERLQAVP